MQLVSESRSVAKLGKPSYCTVAEKQVSNLANSVTALQHLLSFGPFMMPLNKAHKIVDHSSVSS